ncbi:DUF6268 family outer membrane beta-barrel protein [Winogradskyella maritima]|uniref:DUF6268 family outer membrane beta-barrel protein n=1 Tax=Winogradskyella maritima TaxID=1517766 RepID=A0ABV8AG70_9FLAO|nr:DUF6268 family outer membrane beta-barrel protein [Winogradskyella maritima]
MQRTKGFIFTGIFFLSYFCQAQLADLARLDYTILPATDSDFEFNRTRASFNYPIKLNDKQAYLFLGLDYSNINITFGDNEVPFDKEELNGFQLIDLNIGYTFKINKKWRFGARFTPGVSSNLRASDLDTDDVVFSGDVVFINDKKNDPSARKPNRLILGVSYSQNRGFPFPLPFISYYRKFTEKFSYNLGVPKSNFQYHISDAHRLKLYAQLDGFTSNIQQGTLITGEQPERFNMSLILSGLQYEFHFKEHFEFYLRSAYILDRSVQLLDSGNNEIFEIDNSNGFSLRTGLRIKI